MGRAGLGVSGHAASARAGPAAQEGILVRIRIGHDEHTLTWEEWEERVRTGRVPDDALVCFEAVTGDDWVRAGELEMYRSLRNDAAIDYQHRFLQGPPPLLTAALVGFQIRVWWSTWIPGVADRYVRWFTNFTPPTLEDGQAWRLLTMGVLHTETFHIALNMMWLAYTGWNIERALGRANLAVLYIASVTGGSLLSMLGSPETRSLGASGGVFGLVAASVVFGFTRPELLPERGRRLFGAAMLPYLVLMFWSGLMNEGTDNWSHLGGLLVGGALALVLDPVPLQRRPGWNRGWQAAVVGAIALLLAGMGILGPRVYPLPDSEVVRSSFLSTPITVDEDRYSSLSWHAPAGWKPGVNAAGDPGFVSPAGPRSWAVVERQERRPTRPDELLQSWLERLERGWPEAEVSPPVPAVVAGRDGIAVRVTLEEDGEQRIVEWRGTTRGIYGLQEVWEVDAATEARLAPLRDRLRERIEWRSPTLLVEAERDLAHLPRSRKTRGRYADALLRVGEVDEALRLRRELLAESPDVDAWQGLLQILQWYPEVADAEALWERALVEHPTPRIVTEVVQGLEAAGRPEQARALLDIAWGRDPGDRILQRARRNRDLPTPLSEDHLPWDTVYDPVTGARRPEEAVHARISAPLTLEAADARAAVLSDERRRVIEAAARAVREGDPAGLPALLVLRHGHVPESLDEAMTGLLEDAARAREGEAPRWMPPSVVEALRARPDGLEPLAVLAADPVELERRARP